MKIDAIGLEMIVYNDNIDSQNEEWRPRWIYVLSLIGPNE